jgi:branched-chain amino acid transport system permease protein
VVVATVAVTLCLGAVELKIWGASPALLPPPVAGNGIEIAGVVLPPTRLIALGLAVAVCGGLWVFLRTTTFGLGLLGVGQNPTAVRLSGIRLRYLSATTWGLSAALGCAASLVVAPTLGAFTPFFLSRLLLFGFAAAVVGGGLTSLPGAVVGGLALGIWEAYVAKELPSLAGAVDASVFVLLAAALLDRSRRPAVGAAA